GARLALELDRRVGLCLEVEPPRRIALAPAVHRDVHQVVAIGLVAEDRDAFGAGLPPDGVEPHRAPLVWLGGPDAPPAARPSNHRPMDRPGGDDEPERRQERATLRRVGHPRMYFRVI